MVAPSALAIANVLPNGTAGASYSSTITATGGTLPYTCSITGALPSGLSLSGCTVSGTPAAAGNATFTVKVTDSSSPTPQTASASEPIVVAPSALTIANVLPNGTAGASYSSTILRPAATLPYTCSITGTLPSGLSLSGCTVSGTPTEVGQLNRYGQDHRLFQPDAKRERQRDYRDLGARPGPDGDTAERDSRSNLQCDDWSDERHPALYMFDYGNPASRT